VPSDFVALLAVTVLLGAAAIVLLRILGGPEVQRVSRRVMCPQRGGAADCVLLRNVRTGGWESVLHCPLRHKMPPACRSQCLRVLALKTNVGPRARRARQA
jgi:hypothetical protein